MNNSIKIIDVIEHKSKYTTQIFYVLDRMPEIKYERRRSWLIGEDSRFFNFYGYEKPWGGFKAFGGSKFDIPMKDGSIIKADGQWWDVVPLDYKNLVVSVAVSTIERLNKCNVFTGLYANPEILTFDREPSNNYDKYRVGHINFGKHRI